MDIKEEMEEQLKEYFTINPKFRIYFCLVWFIFTVGIIINVIKISYQIVVRLISILWSMLEGILSFNTGFFSFSFHVIQCIFKLIFRVLILLIKIPITLPTFLIRLKLNIIMYAWFSIFYIVYTFCVYLVY